MPWELIQESNPHANPMSAMHEPIFLDERFGQQLHSSRQGVTMPGDFAIALVSDSTGAKWWPDARRINRAKS
jgi:hypothetical protein